jgi:hypothetical protein
MIAEVISGRSSRYSVTGSLGLGSVSPMIVEHRNLGTLGSCAMTCLTSEGQM